MSWQCEDALVLEPASSLGATDNCQVEAVELMTDSGHSIQQPAGIMLQDSLIEAGPTLTPLLHRDLKQHLATAFADLAADSCNRPTYLAEIIPDEPKIVGTTDAARQGMGGVFF